MPESMPERRSGPGPVCVVVGAGPGLGAALAQRFADGGYRVALLGRNIDRLDQLTESLTGAGSNGRDAIAIAADAGDEESLRTGLDEVSAIWDTPQVLLYNAAVLETGGPLQLSADALLAHAKVDYVGALTAARYLAPAMLDRARCGGRATLLFTGGGLADQPAAAATALSVGKAALRALVSCLAQELTPQGVQAASVTIRGTIQPGTAFDPAAIAERYWAWHGADPTDWQPEYAFTGDNASTDGGVDITASRPSGPAHDQDGHVRPPVESH